MSTKYSHFNKLCIRAHHIFCVLLFLFVLLGNTTLAQTVVSRLRTVTLYSDSTILVSKAGEPAAKEAVARYFYGNDQVVVANGSIIDIRLTERNRKIRLRRGKNEEGGTVLPVSLLRIGMTESEALSMAGKPDAIMHGADWYYTKRHRVELSNGKVTKVDLHIKANLETLDWVRLNFSNGSLLLMNITIAFIMFGVALGIKLSSFKELAKNPKPVLVGILSQFALLPALTFVLVLILKPSPSIAMGMILVAACPGGNVSNFISSLAKGNMALSVSLTGIATLAALFMTPFNFALWGGLYSQASDLVIPFSIDIYEMLKTVFILLGIPIVLGVWFAGKFPVITQKIQTPVKYLSIIIFIGYVVAALASNINYFFRYIHLILLIVLLHNALAFVSGYSFASLFRLPDADRRAITIETGIQNSGLGLVLIFNPNLFNGLGGMAFIAAWWGIWHIVAGFALGSYWARKPLKTKNAN